MEMKWFCICLTIMLVLCISGVMFSHYIVTQCKISYSTSTLSPKEIKSICNR
jgi:hypothetical protein